MGERMDYSSVAEMYADTRWAVAWIKGPLLKTVARLPANSANAEGTIALDDSFISKLEQKCGSAMRLISPEAHARGVDRLRWAAERREEWASCYTVLTYERT